jgi:basic membrane lipoprotein Med (substrate-binding protein (PBP1-ABC) superfamily)
MKKWFRLLIALFALSLIAAACGDSDSDSESESSGDDAAAASDTSEAAGSDEAAGLRVAVVTPSAANDLAFSQSIVDALEALEEQGYISELAVSEGLFIVEDAGTALRDYAEEGYDLVVGHGSQYGALLEAIAPDFPDTAFAWGTAANTFDLPNVSAYTAASDQGGYVMGVMAAGLADGAGIGVVGPVEVGDAKLFVDGFIAGAASAGGDATAVYTDNFGDTALAAEAAQSFISNGAAVLTGTAQMTVGAIGVANEEGVPWFGTQSNQTQVAPDIVVANQVYKWDVVLVDLVTGVQAGNLGGSTYEITLANGGLVIEFNDGYELPADVRSAGDAAAAGITDGSMSTGLGE